jgi:hypothetical protein
MLSFLTIGILVGTLFGLRFKVFVLVPVIVLAWAIIAVIGVANGYGGWKLAAALTIIAISIQMGYLCGSALCSLARTAWTSRERAAPMPIQGNVSGSLS